MTLGAKLDRRMEAKVDAEKMYLLHHLGLHEKLVIELAMEIDKKQVPVPVAVSFASQKEATVYFNEHGFVATLEYMLSLETQRLLRETP